MDPYKLSGEVLELAIAVHRHLGPGLLESVYESCLEIKLKKAGLKVVRQRALSIEFEGVKLDAAYKIDLLVEDRLLIELKAVEALAPIHKAQALTYLKLANLPYGLLINFNVELLKDGVQRVYNNRYRE